MQLVQRRNVNSCICHHPSSIDHRITQPKLHPGGRREGQTRQRAARTILPERQRMRPPQARHATRLLHHTAHPERSPLLARAPVWAMESHARRSLVVGAEADLVARVERRRALLNLEELGARLFRHVEREETGLPRACRV